MGDHPSPWKLGFPLTSEQSGRERRNLRTHFIADLEIVCVCVGGGAIQGPRQRALPSRVHFEKGLHSFLCCPLQESMTEVYAVRVEGPRPYSK